MFQIKHLLKYLALTALILSALLEKSTGLPASACMDEGDEDDCAEARMHPDLPPAQSPVGRQISGEDTNSYWLSKSKDFIRQQARVNLNPKSAKNIILFLGDGMGLTTVAAARNLLGGEEQQLSFEKFPYTGLSKTYSVNTIISDSACTSTAYLCGVKANHGTIGVNGQVQRDDCQAMRDTKNHVHSIAKWALDAGKAAGFVTTTRVTHASPAGVYAHTADRNWEHDAALKKDCGPTTDLPDIAQQLIHGEVGSKLKVIMGGGKSNFIDSSLFKKGLRQDGRNLIDEYLQQSAKNAYVETKKELFDVNLNYVDRLLGIFHNSNLDYHLDAVNEKDNTQPTLEEMTQRAIEFLQNEANGYFLFVEGGKIDMGHHDTQARIALDETVEFSKAIELARKLTNEEDTLIVVTADHSHTFSFAGYQQRGSDIFGVALTKAEDGKPYMSLNYANGPGYSDYYNTNKNNRRNPEKVISDSAHETFPATAPMKSETHGGEDVPVYASGPWSHLFTGVYEQNTIPHLMAYAACVGDGLKAC